MNRLLWPIALLALVLLIPVVPFLLFHQQIDVQIQDWLRQGPTPSMLIGWLVGLLATDVFLPVPSSLVSTAAGAQLGWPVATLATWIGMNLGAVVGYVAGRSCGSLAQRLADPHDLEQMNRLANQHGAWLLVLTRALPLLAEATVLLMGINRLPWRRFLPPVVLSNLGVAIAYSALGHVSTENEWLPFALAVSVAIPLLVTLLVRRRLHAKATEA